MTYRHDQRRALLRRFVAQKVWGDADATLPKQLPSWHLRQRLDSARNAARIAQHPLRTRRTVLGSLRSSNPTIRAAAKGLAIRTGLLAKVVPVSGVPYATGKRLTRAQLEQQMAAYDETVRDAWRGR